MDDFKQLLSHRGLSAIVWSYCGEPFTEILRIYQSEAETLDASAREAKLLGNAFASQGIMSDVAGLAAELSEPQDGPRTRLARAAAADGALNVLGECWPFVKNITLMVGPSFRKLSNVLIGDALAHGQISVMEYIYSRSGPHSYPDAAAIYESARLQHKAALSFVRFPMCYVEAAGEALQLAASSRDHEAAKLICEIFEYTPRMLRKLAANQRI